MSQLIVFNLGVGDWQQGFPAVTVQLWQPDRTAPMQWLGALPPAPELEQLYHHWQRLYRLQSDRLNWRASIGPEIESEFEIDEDDIIYISRSEFQQCCQALQQQLNRWLNSEPFRQVDQKLRSWLALTDEIRVVITADRDRVLKLPWRLWQFFEDYTQAELGLSPANYTRSEQTQTARRKIRILAILGDSRGIDIAHDQHLLQQLPDAEVTFLVEPSRSQLTQQLWESGWDVLFFAGHSSSNEQGHIQVNPHETLTVEQLKYGLRHAIQQGLKLAIFNSCDGLGLALDLADLHLPQVIVMREPVPDRVAQEFLKQFLAAFSQGRSLYLSVREAREKLQDLEGPFPCATWLPVICQNPAEIPTTWQDWCPPKPVRSLPTWRDWQMMFLSSVAVTSLVLLGRWLGVLQPLELAAWDQFMLHRPIEAPDNRLLVVTINEQDIAAQGNEPRRGSLSDRTLNKLLQTLESAKPAAIGLDLYRDYPAELPALKNQMQQSDRLISLCKRPDAKDDQSGVLPPPEIPADRLGFSDFVEDYDGVLRRHLLAVSPTSISSCSPTQAFSVNLAFRYLNQKGINTIFTPDNYLKLGNQTRLRLTSRTSGYQSVDAQGIQVLLNYRSLPPRTVAPQVSLTQILSGQLNPNVVKDRIVLIGVITNTSGDYWSTPYGTAFAQQVPGVFVQAHLVSQLLSAGLDGRSLIWTWMPWAEGIWVGGWSLMGAMLVCRMRSGRTRAIGLMVLLGTLTGICFVLLLNGGWIPWIPPLIAIVVTSTQVGYLLSRSPISQSQKQPFWRIES